MYPSGCNRPKLDCPRGPWEGNAKLVKQLEAVQIAAAEKKLGCSSTTVGLAQC